MKVIVAGSTGAIGRHVVAQLAANTACETVTALVRREVEVAKVFPLKHENDAAKVKPVVVDYEKLCTEPQTYATIFEGAGHAVSCLGTTRADAGSAEAFRHVDLDYNDAFAKLAAAQGVKSFGLVSAMNACAKSWFTYPKVKGEAEEAVKACNFDSVFIYRPGLLLRGEASRAVERWASWVMPSIDVVMVARTIVRDALGEKEKGVKVVWDKEMKQQKKEEKEEEETKK